MPSPFSGMDPYLEGKELMTAIPTEIPHYVVEVVDKESQQLVTSIEVLSPANK